MVGSDRLGSCFCQTMILVMHYYICEAGLFDESFFAVFNILLIIYNNCFVAINLLITNSA